MAASSPEVAELKAKILYLQKTNNEHRRMSEQAESDVRDRDRKISAAKDLIGVVLSKSERTLQDCETALRDALLLLERDL